MIKNTYNRIYTKEKWNNVNSYNKQVLEDFFGLSVRVVLNKIRTANPNIPEIYREIVEEYSSVEGGIEQRINIMPIKPTSPRYRNLQDGDSVDRWTVRKPRTKEYFFQKNFDFQNFVSLQEINLKQMFLSETGIFSYIEGITKTFNDSYYIQKAVMMKEMLSLAINGDGVEVRALRDSQKKSVRKILANDLSTQEEFYRTIKNFVDTERVQIFTGANNAGAFEQSFRVEEHVLIVRATMWNILECNLRAPSFLKESYGLPIKVILTDNFGGLQYVLKNSPQTVLKPVYDEKTGEEIGFNTTGGTGTIADCVPEEDIAVVDPNEDIVAVIAQRGVIFSTIQNPYEVRATEVNQAGLYKNLWASQPNGAFCYDPYYDLVTFTEIPDNAKKTKKTSTEDNKTESPELQKPEEQKQAE